MHQAAKGTVRSHGVGCQVGWRGNASRLHDVSDFKEELLHAFIALL